jgi:hypothetical protein
MDLSDIPAGAGTDLIDAVIFQAVIYLMFDKIKSLSLKIYPNSFAEIPHRKP